MAKKKTKIDTKTAKATDKAAKAAVSTAEKTTSTTADQIPEVPEEQTVITSTASHIVLKDTQDPLAKWYVLHTYSGHEHKVAEGIRQRVDSMKLNDFIVEMLIPTQEKIQIRRGKKQTVKEKIFPGYLLIRMIMTDQSWLAVRTTQGVTGFVGTAKSPTALPLKEVEAIQKYMSQGIPSYKTAFSVGEAVRIIEGPFTDFLGTIDVVDEGKGKVTVLVSIFGRETPVELDFLQVAKI